MRLLAATLALGTVLVASPAFAGDIPFTHDGFLLRLDFGLGYESLSLSQPGEDITIGGFGGALEIGVGAMITEDLAINAVLLGSDVASPSVSENGTHLGTANDTSVSLAMLGVGLTYYLEPLNLYFAPSIGLSKATITIQDSSFEAKWGFAAECTIGKEWWAGENWGLGIAVQAILSPVPTEEDGADATYFAFNVAFTATYN